MQGEGPLKVCFFGHVSDFRALSPVIRYPSAMLHCVQNRTAQCIHQRADQQIGEECHSHNGIECMPSRFHSGDVTLCFVVECPAAVVCLRQGGSGGCLCTC